MAEAALEDLADTPTGSVQRAEQALETIHGQLLRIGEIIHHTRQIGRRDDERPGLFDPVAVARTVTEVLQHEARKRKVHLDAELPPTGPLILGHAVRFEQVLKNLLYNGLDAAEDAHGNTGRGYVSVSICHEARMVTVSVSDNGPGIPDEHRHRIFEPFFTTKSGEHGSGSWTRHLSGHRGGNEWPDRRAGAANRRSPLRSSPHT